MANNSSKVKSISIQKTLQGQRNLKTTFIMWNYTECALDSNRFFDHNPDPEVRVMLDE